MSNEVYSQEANRDPKIKMWLGSGNKTELTETGGIPQIKESYSIINVADKYQYGFYGKKNHSESTQYKKIIPVLHYEEVGFQPEQKKYFTENSTNFGF